MSDIILKQTSLTTEKKGEVCIGDLLYDRDGVYPVIGFKERSYTDRDGEINKSIVILVDNHRWSNNEPYEITEKSFSSYYGIIKGYSFDEIDEISNKILQGNLSMDDLTPKDNSGDSNSTSLMVLNKDVITAKRDEMVRFENRVKLVQSLVQQKIDSIQSKINGAMQQFKKVITRLNKVIFTLELYSGIEEEILQIQSGNAAEESEPIHLNQLMRYMDEEVGDPDNEGVTFDTIEKFHDWLLSYSEHLGCYYYELILPQPKSVRTMRVRQDTRESLRRDPYNNRWEIVKDMSTFILIRNGENIYIIDSKMVFESKMFPDEKELEDIFKIKDEDERFDALSTYKNGLILMQGLVDRTNVFGNLQGKVSFLTTDSQDEGKIKFQYEMDEKSQITDGKETLLDFMTKFPIEAGVRAMIWDTTRYHYLDQYGRGESRFTREYRSSHSAPYAPDDGVYKLVAHNSVNHPKGTLKFLYESERRWYDRDKDRMRTGWIVRPNDSNVVDIDSISHRNIDWINNMMYDRKLRRDYVRAMGMLKSVKDFKNKELEMEQPFVKLMMSLTGKNELEVKDAVHWWKTKNKYKRPIDEDDKKAIRMIKKYLKDPVESSPK